MRLTPVTWSYIHRARAALIAWESRGWWDYLSSDSVETDPVKPEASHASALLLSPIVVQVQVNGELTKRATDLEAIRTPE